MKRVDRDALRVKIVIALAVMKPHLKARTGIASEAAREEIADDLLRRIMGLPESEAVILIPDLVGSAHSPRRGRWGVDEPHPHPDLPFADH